ncbi:hypothetical protein TNCV_2164841 [Trichonephila clavipes]|nr:hypothetical protein TNCV_2164841 [Trichonephila clavipes]
MSSNTRCSGLSRQRGYSTSRITRSPDLYPIENVWDALGGKLLVETILRQTRTPSSVHSQMNGINCPQQLLDNVVQRPRHLNDRLRHQDAGADVKTDGNPKTPCLVCMVYVASNLTPERHYLDKREPPSFRTLFFPFFVNSITNFDYHIAVYYTINSLFAF